MEQKNYQTIFIEQVKHLLQSGIAASKAEIAEKLEWDANSLISAMKGRRPVPQRVYKKLTEVYRLPLSDVSQEAKNGVMIDISKPDPMAAIISMSESNKLLAESNKTLAKNNEDLIQIFKTTVDAPQQIPLTLEARFAALLELIAQVGTGKHWKSVQEAHAALSKQFYGGQVKKQALGTQKG